MRKAISTGKKSPLSRRADRFSLWAGQFDSLEQLELHIDSGEFERQHGFKIEPPLLPFNAFLDDATPDRLVRLLVKDAALVSRIVKALGDARCNALLLHQYFAFAASLAPRGRKRMQFVGTFAKR